MKKFNILVASAAIVFSGAAAADGNKYEPQAMALCTTVFNMLPKEEQKRTFGECVDHMAVELEKMEIQHNENMKNKRERDKEYLEWLEEQNERERKRLDEMSKADEEAKAKWGF